MSLARATFHRVTERRDEVAVVRADGSATSWSCPTYGGTIPHDLVHVIVETVFGLERGLWGCILGGLDMKGVRRTGQSREGGELLTAEALATVNWYDAALDGAQRCEAVIEACAALRAAPPARLDATTCERVTALLKPLKGWCRALAMCGGDANVDVGEALLGDLEIRVRTPLVVVLDLQAYVAPRLPVR